MHNPVHNKQGILTYALPAAHAGKTLGYKTNVQGNSSAQHNPREDAALIANKNVAAEQWLNEHGSALYRYALLHMRNAHRAEEAVQETLLAALQAYDRFAGGGSVRTWLIGILKHKIIDQFRRDAREVPLEDTESIVDQNDSDEDTFTEAGRWRNRPASWGNPEQLLENRQFLQILQHCLEYLPKRHARLFMLREVMEQSTEEICEELSITPSNVWTMLHRARLELRQCLEKNGIFQAKGNTPSC